MLTTKIPYTISTIDDIPSVYRNIFVFRNSINAAAQNQEAIYRYIIKDGDTPRSLSNLLYGAEYYDWVICTLNNIVNPYYDWPLSEESFYEMIEEKYLNKQCFFIDLITIDKNFIPGETITQGSTQGQKTAKVHSWDRTLAKLTVTDVSSEFELEPISTPSANGTIKRIIQKSEDALHHFETTSGGILDPYSGYLELYLNGTDSFVVTNKQYEIKENDKKRSIYILKPDYLMTVVANTTKGMIQLQDTEIEE